MLEAGAALSAPQKRRSRNDLFDTTWTSPSPNVSRSRRSSASSQITSSPVTGSLPAEILEYLPKDPKDLPCFKNLLPIRYSPTHRYLLGNGKHSSVYLGACLLQARWSLCAIKRINSDQESQRAALNEVYVLSRLDSPFIPKLLALKNECDSTVEFLEADAIQSNRSSRRPSFNAAVSRLSLTLDENAPHFPESSSKSPLTTSGEHVSQEHAHVRRVLSLKMSQNSLSSPSDLSPAFPSAQSRLILVQELCPKGSLASFIRRHPQKLGRVFWLRLAKHIVTALADCHRANIIHGDVKTHNVMLTKDLDARLTDFGTSIPIRDGHRPLSGLGLGTTPYNAPELIRLPPQPFGTEVDVFSCGITLYTMITGREPYANMRPVEQAVHVARGDYWELQQQRRLAVMDDQLDLRAPLSLSSSSRPPSIYSLANGSSDSIDSAGSLLGSHKTGRLSKEAVAQLLGESLTDHVLSPLSASDTDLPTSSLATEDPDDLALDGRWAKNGSLESRSGGSHSPMQTYSDGSPVEYFLSGLDVVPEGVIRLLEKMTQRDPSKRPEMQEVANALSVF